MRKLASRLSLLLLFAANSALAQVGTTYTRTAGTGGIYTALPIGNLVAYQPSSTDVAAYAVITLPFTFTYNGVGYTEVTASVDGWLAMGSFTTVSSVSADLFTTTAPQNAIAPWWGNGGPNPNSGGKFLAASTGTDIYTIQWEQQSGSSTGGNSSSNKISYQVSLYGPSSSSPGKIEVLYGPNNGTPSSGRSSGIKSVTGGTVSFINGLNGSTSSTATNSAWPGSGVTHTYTVTPTCSVPTNAATAFTVGATTPSTINVSFTAAAGSPSGYVVVRTPFGTPATAPTDGQTYTAGNGLGGYIESVGASTSVISTGLSSNTQYSYTIYSFNTNCLGGPLYLTASTLTGDASTGGCTVFGSTGAQLFSVGPTGNFASLGAAVSDINSCGGVSGPVILELQSTYSSSVESFPIALSALNGTSAANTLTIRPEASASGLSITSNSATGTVQLNGAKYFIIDGRPGGVGSSKQLTLSNNGGGYAVQLTNDASNDIIRYCVLKSNNVSTTSGTVVFSTTTGSTGNDNNLLDNNDIGDAASSLIPHTAVYSLGTTTTAALGNSGVTVSNNNIFNFFSAGSGSNGISLQAGNTDWTITGNSFYQTATRTSSGGATHTGININNTTGSNFLVSANYIGGSAAQCGGSAWNFAGTNSNRFRAITLSVANSPLSSVQGNTFTNFTMVSTNVTASGGGPMVGIYLNSGSANIGGVSGNTIGSASGSSLIQLTLFTNSGANPCGILADPSSSNSIISNNTISAIIVIGNTNTNAIGFTAIATSSGTAYTISNNSIGSNYNNSIQANNSSLLGPSQIVSGITCSGGSPVLTISGNTISNLNNAYLMTTPATASLVRGIYVTGGRATISGNTIYNLIANGSSTGTGANATVVGIANATATTGAWAITQNTVYGLSAIHSTAATTIIGIYNSGSTTLGTVGRNLVYNLSAESDAATATGIEAAGGTASYQNNMVRMGTGNSLGQSLIGIAETGGSANFFYHNTIYIGGTALSGGRSSYAFSSTPTTGTRDIRNNIFVTTRSGGSNHHYAVRVGGTAASPAGLTLNNNIYSSQVTDLGFFNGNTYNSLAGWQAAVGLDANSFNAVPCFVNATHGTNPDLHLTNCSGIGNIAEGAGSSTLNGAVTLTDDFDGQTRATAALTPVDAGADAGNFSQLNDATIESVTQPTATSCHSATESVIVTLKNNHSNTLTFANTPVTITTTVSGATSATISRTLDGSFLPATVAPGASVSVVVGEINTTANGTYNIESTVSVFNDANAANDVHTTSVTINYTALAVSAQAATPSFCGPGATTITATPSGGTAPYSYSWSTGATTQSVSTGTVASTTNYSVTVTDNCGISANDGTTVTILPALTAQIEAAQTLFCSTGGSTTVNVSNGPANGSVTYTTNGATPQSLQLDGSGAGSFSTGTLTASTTYTITSISNGSCSSASTESASVYIGTIVADPASNVSVCAGSAVASVVFSGNFPAGTQYSWTSTDGVAIGMASNSGTGTSLPGFTSINAGSDIAFTDVSVIPIINIPGCKPHPMIFRITVRPLPTVNSIGNQTVCAGTMTTPVTFSGATAGTHYTWTNNNPAIGMAASGAGNLPAFTAQNNTGSATISGTFSVTPVAAGCSGTPTTFTIAVNRSVVSISYTGSPYCQVSTVNPVINGTRGGTFSAVSALAINALSGQINLGQSQPGIYTITYTAPASGGACGGVTTTQVRIKPQATVDNIGNQLYCNGITTAPFTFPGTATNYAWSNNNPAIGLAASGTGTALPSFTTVNGGPATQYAYVAVTPLGNGTTTCNGRAFKFRIAVNFCPPITQAGGNTGGDATARRASAPLLVSPNPSAARITVQLGAESNYILQLVDRFGRPAGSTRNVSGNTANIDLGTLLPGTYLLQVTDRKTGQSRQVQVVKL
ncbi:MAG: hypothetical protein EOO15_02805 [Chitinophagaceae bacterium]|nr:MAG: hypothetical protein EOO15_02805 [Chitinophagaceae bacterium]